MIWKILLWFLADEFGEKILARWFAIPFLSEIFIAITILQQNVGGLLFLPVIFWIICNTFFGYVLLINFRNVISSWIFFGVFNDFLGFRSAVFISV